MGFYTNLIILTELLMLAMVFHVINYSGFKKEQKTWYLLTFITIMLCSAAEYAVHCGYYDPKYALPLTILTVIQFSLAPMLAVLFIGALGLKAQSRIAAVFFSVNALVEIALAPSGRVFYFNDEGYFRGDLFMVYEVFYVISLLYLVVCMILVGRKFRHRDIPTICMILVILVAGIIPMTLFKINITYIAVAMSSSLCYIYYNDLVQQDLTAELLSKQDRIQEMQRQMISGLASLIENRDLDTGDHISRTSACVRKLAELARQDGVYTSQISNRFVTLMYTLAPMHDIGKIVIPDSILKKPGRLTPEEYNEMKKHAEAGGTIVNDVLRGTAEADDMLFAADIALYHHEKWDGTGYPKGLKGEDIPLSARIMAIADVFDALISDRCYKDAIPVEEAFEIIREGAGTHFDPKLAEVFLNHKEEFE
ncbi:MAG: HD domain-containing protein [Lachnospiraceae bacterium]|nr:HD domain-containing protein [Lachnospiraceae bacterium]